VHLYIQINLPSAENRNLQLGGDCGECKMRAESEINNKSSAVAELGDGLTTIDMGQKWGGMCPFLGGDESRCNALWPGPTPTSVPSGILIHAAVWSQCMCQNWGYCAPFWGGEEAGSSSSTMWPGPRPTSVQSFVLIHPTVWPQYQIKSKGILLLVRNKPVNHKSTHHNTPTLQT